MLQNCQILKAANNFQIHTLLHYFFFVKKFLQTIRSYWFQGVSAYLMRTKQFYYQKETNNQKVKNLNKRKTFVALFLTYS